MLRKALAIAARPAYWRGLRHGVGAGIEHHAFLGAKRWGTILDVGANKGQFSLAAHRLQPRARIIAFEPLTEACAIYRRLFADVADVTIHPFALGAAEGADTIHISARQDCSSLLPIGRGLIETFPGTEESGTAAVPIRTLASFAPFGPKPVLLKIDVQGYELEVLKGADLAGIDDIYVELSWRELYRGQPLAGDVTAWLESRGFAPAARYNPTRDGSAVVQADCHFVKR